MPAVWAEMDAVLADEFRDGNVPAQMAPLTVAKAAFAALPKTVTSYYYRGDSACHEKELLRWLSNESREEGPQGCIGFAISVRMSLAAGVLPSKYFGANAAWLRLAVIAYNVLTALKRLALPADLLTARPKRLRFLIFHTAGRLVHHARQLSLRLATALEGITICLEAVRILPLPT
jgi:hypothetical protein